MGTIRFQQLFILHWELSLNLYFTVVLGRHAEKLLDQFPKYMIGDPANFWKQCISLPKCNWPWGRIKNLMFYERVYDPGKLIMRQGRESRKKVSEIIVSAWVFWLCFSLYASSDIPPRVCSSQLGSQNYSQLLDILLQMVSACVAGWWP